MPEITIAGVSGGTYSAYLGEPKSKSLCNEGIVLGANNGTGWSLAF